MKILNLLVIIMSMFSVSAFSMKLKSGSSLKNSIMYFEKVACPDGWTHRALFDGRYLVGVSTSGAISTTGVGIALGNLENRPVGQHGHTITDPTHNHTVAVQVTLETGGTGLDHDNVTGTGIRQTARTDPLLTINSTGTVAGTNLPYIQLQTCIKD